MQQDGKFILFIGPMNSGKTNALIIALNRYIAAHRKVVLFRRPEDKRFGPADSSSEFLVVSRNSLQMPAVPVESLCEAVKRDPALLEADVIGVDEGQFFDDLCLFAEQMTVIGKVVIVAALNGTYQQQPWPVISKAIAMADKTTFYTAICVRPNCGKDAPFSHRISDDTELKVIGGSDKYESLCRGCLAAATCKPTTT